MGKYFKKFATQAEHDNFLMTEQDVPKPNISLIENEKKSKIQSNIPFIYHYVER